MAASDNNPRSHQPPPGSAYLGAEALDARLDEEIRRGERHGTALSCLLLLVENLDELARAHGGELRERTLEYIAAALPPELRRFDRIGRPSERELLIVLPGADGPRGEMVARRVLDRLRTVKVEAGGTRRALHIAVGLTAWRERDDAAQLLTRARAAAARSSNGEGAQAAPVEDRGGEREASASHPPARSPDAPPAPGPDAAS